MLFKIIKKAPNSFWHLYNNGSKEVNLSDFEVVLDLIAQTFNIQCLNGANVPNQSVQVANIRVIDETAGIIEETFQNVIALKNRLTTLGYTPYKSSTGIEEAPVDGNTYGRKDEGWIIITGGGGTQTLAQVLVEGNTTGGENIVINNADAIELENTSSLKKGTYNFGGNGGISRICSNNYEDMWQNGFRHVFDQSGFIRNSTNCFDIIPDETFDDTLRFKDGSIWTLDDGTSYICTDATTGAAEWELANQITLQEVLDFNHSLVGGKNFQGTGAGLGATGNNINAFGTNAALFNSGDALNALGNTSGNNNSGNNVNAFGEFAGVNNSFDYVNLLGQNAVADEDGQTVLSKDGTIMARISTTDLTATRKYNLPDADGTLALTTDLNTPTLQEVTDEGNITTNGIQTGNIIATDVAGGNPPILLQLDTNEGNTIIGVTDTSSGFSYAITSDILTGFRQIMIPDANGTLALTSDIAPQTLQQVTNLGSVTSNDIQVTVGSSSSFLRSDSLKVDDGTTNNIVITGNRILFNKTNTLELTTPTFTQARTQTFQNASGTLALTSDLTNINTNATHKDTVKLSEAINKGQAVYISGANGTNILVSKASNTTEALSSKTLGLLETTGALNAIVNVVTDGLLSGLNTSTATIGDAVWLGTSGNLLFGLANKPVAPAHLVYIGVVSRVSATVGEIIVKIQNGFELSEIHDVALLSVANNQLLSYDSATSLWKNKNLNQIVSERRNANNTSNNNINYCGNAANGSAESSAVWTIKRLTIAASGAITVGTATNVAWTNRESATYI